MKTYTSYIWINGAWKKVKPVITNVTNMGKVPSNALYTNAGIPFLTKSKEFFLVDPATPGLTAESTEDYLLREMPQYTAKIF